MAPEPRQGDEHTRTGTHTCTHAHIHLDAYTDIQVTHTRTHTEAFANIIHTLTSGLETPQVQGRAAVFPPYQARTAHPTVQLVTVFVGT